MFTLQKLISFIGQNCQVDPNLQKNVASIVNGFGKYQKQFDGHRKSTEDAQELNPKLRLSVFAEPVILWT